MNSPPNGQGIATLAGLTMLEALGVGEHPVDSLETVHPVLEAMKLALADLDEHVADSEHMRVPSADLLGKAYLTERAGLITDQAANPGTARQNRVARCTCRQRMKAA